MAEDELKEWKKHAERYPIIIARDIDDVYVLAPLTVNFMLTVNPGFDADEGKYEPVLSYTTYNSTIWNVIPNMRWQTLTVKRLKEAVEEGCISRIVFYKLRYHIAKFLKQVKEQYNIDIDIDGTYSVLAEYVNKLNELAKRDN